MLTSTFFACNATYGKPGSRTSNGSAFQDHYLGSTLFGGSLKLGKWDQHTNFFRLSLHLSARLGKIKSFLAVDRYRHRKGVVMTFVEKRAGQTTRKWLSSVYLMWRVLNIRHDVRCPTWRFDPDRQGKRAWGASSPPALCDVHWSSARCLACGAWLTKFTSKIVQTYPGMPMIFCCSMISATKRFMMSLSCTHVLRFEA